MKSSDLKSLEEWKRNWLLEFNTSKCKVMHLTKSTGYPKSHCAKVRAYCSACDRLIRKLSSGMLQKSSSLEEFNGFGEIDVQFFE